MITVQCIQTQLPDPKSHCPLGVCIDGSPQQPWEGGQFCYPKITGEEREAPTVQVTCAWSKSGTGARKQMYFDLGRVCLQVITIHVAPAYAWGVWLHVL